MTKLQKLYSTIQNLKEFGLELGDDLLKQTSELKQEIIKKKNLPVVSDKIEPIISQIQRELVLVVDYLSNEPLRLIVMTIVVFLTESMSNTATATLLILIMISASVAFGISPLILVITVTIATSFAFMLPVATPPNAIGLTTTTCQ